jgi:hypothetical protein
MESVTIEVSRPFPIFRITRYFIDGEHVASVADQLRTEGNVSIIISTTITVLSDSFSKECFVAI